MPAALLTETSRPSVAGYAFENAPNLASERDRAKLSGSALKAFLNIAAKWKLSELQCRGLLGGVASSTYHAWKASPRTKKLDQDTLTRISLVIGIYKALSIYFSRPWSDRWITLENRGPLFAGGAPIDYMLRHGQPGMVTVRRMLDAWRGGQ